MKALLSTFGLVLTLTLFIESSWACMSEDGTVAQSRNKGECSKVELPSISVQSYLSKHDDFEYVEAKVYYKPCPPCPEGAMCKPCATLKDFLLVDLDTGMKLALNSIELMPHVITYLEKKHKPGDVLNVRIRDNDLNDEPLIISVIIP